MDTRTKAYRKQLADAFIHVLEEEELHWKKEWQGFGLGQPTNAVTGYRYQGLNRFYLGLVARRRGYQDPRWCTFLQIKNQGWNLLHAKGQGVKVEYWFPFDTEKKKSVTWKEFREEAGEFGERYVLRVAYATVFNGALIEGIPQLVVPEHKEITPDALVKELSANMGVEIRNDGGDRAFYSPAEDAIHLPVPQAFDSQYAYDSTALHELAHATGAPDRLNRPYQNGFGTQGYAFEELIAEISSCFLSVNLPDAQDERHLENHKAYVQSWISSIREKPETLTQAIRQAERAACYMEYKAGLLPLSEYEKTEASAMEVPDRVVDSPKTDTKEREILNQKSPPGEYGKEKEKMEEKRRKEKDGTVKKQRLFVDMDGTLAVFQKVDTLETLYEKGYFENLNPIPNTIQAVKEILREHPDVEVYILSAHLADSPYALREKNAWLDKYLPEIDDAHRIFPPCGEDKKAYLPGGIRNTDFLLDDYTHNLLLWEPPARGIKLLNGINHTRGTWEKDRLWYEKDAHVLAENIVDIMQRGARILDENRSAAKDRQSEADTVRQTRRLISDTGRQTFDAEERAFIIRYAQSSRHLNDVKTLIEAMLEAKESPDTRAVSFVMEAAQKEMTESQPGKSRQPDAHMRARTPLW